MTVYVAFCRAKGIISRLITWATGQGPSHAFLVYRDDGIWGCAMQVSAEAGGLMVMPARLAGSVSAVYAVPHTAEALRKNADQLGAGYDYAGLLGMTKVMFFWLLFKRKVKNPFQSSRRWFCSEFTARVLLDAGYTLCDEPGDIEPGRLEDDVVKNGCLRVPWEMVIK